MCGWASVAKALDLPKAKKKKDVGLPFAPDRKIGKFTVGGLVFFLLVFFIFFKSNKIVHLLTNLTRFLCTNSEIATTIQKKN